MSARNIAAADDLGTDRDPCLLAEAAFEPNSPFRDAHAIELFPDEPIKRAQFRLAWDCFQQRFEEGAL